MAYVKKPAAGAADNPVVPAAPTIEEHATEDAKADAMTIEYMRKHFAERPKVSVRCSEDQWVQVNGYTFIIKANERVMVPDEIAQMLEDAGRI